MSNVASAQGQNLSDSDKETIVSLQIMKLVEFLIDEVTTSHKEHDEVVLEAEKVKELADHCSSEASRLQVFRDTALRTWEELIACDMCAELCIHPCLIQECKHMFCLRCLQKWFADMEEPAIHLSNAGGVL
ncbi:hypothetical protein SCLCIDRAFT_27199 [Scleroderma citrinum Foug A]|uniref:RING-type domain-containing protein n=1 Tax=Scleroderma citrinum Foug A TaxID=1036808 RepID=A0A0C3A4N1_9AGAM|nr:hypothetical protein SCLCIDRAFT_27199 [Scleroderma citrinum Foug A]